MKDIKEWIDIMEVKPLKPGRYVVTICKFGKDLTDKFEYFQKHLDFNGTSWNYDEHSLSRCWVCFVHRKWEETTSD